MVACGKAEFQILTSSSWPANGLFDPLPIHKESVFAIGAAAATTLDVSKNPFTYVINVFVAALYRSMKRLPATASGLSFGLAIAAGGVPFAAGIDTGKLNTPLVIIEAILLTMLMVKVGFGKAREKQNA